jgi:thiol-disulfide isomerase/thioredoxin
MFKDAFGCSLATCLLYVFGACKESGPPPAPPAVQTAKASPVEPGPSVTKAVPPAQTAEAPAPGTPAQDPGLWYRVSLVFDRVGELPFFLHVPSVGQSGRAYVQNGANTFDFQAEWHHDDINITGSWAYIMAFAAHREADTGKLVGTWTRDTPIWGAVVRNFVATPIKEPDPRLRFSDDDTSAPVNLAGTWKFQFDEHKEGKGAFEQGPDGVIHGYIQPGQLGDLGSLAGNVHGRKLSLSMFNGNAANLVLAKVSADGKSMSGLLSMQDVWNEKFTAKKVDDFQLVNKVHLKKGEHTISLQGLGKYKGKPTLAIIFATWCPVCHAAHSFFKQLYAKYHAQGLEVLGVAYDLSEDEKSNLAELEKYRATQKIPWELLQEPCTPETWAKTMPPEIEGWDGFPIVALVSPDGTVQDVYGGWLGPATGADGEHLRTWMDGEIQKLIAKR